MDKTVFQKSVAAGLGLAMLAMSAMAQDKLPDFLSKVQLHNCAGVEPTADGTGVMLYRLPRVVRETLDRTNAKGEELDPGRQMRAAVHSEIRFVLNDGVSRGDVKIYLKSEVKPVDVTVFWGDVLAGTVRVSHGDRAKPVNLPGHGMLDNMISNNMPSGRFPNRVCRVVVDGFEVSFNGIDGDVRPPRPEELPPVMLSYGTSICQGAYASRSYLAWNALTARALGYDCINLGSSGTAYCEPAMADYLASLKWDLCVLEISVNMTGHPIDVFKERATYLVDKLAKTHPDAPIFCISLFPWGVGDIWQKGEKANEFRQALAEIVKATPHKNVYFVGGPDLLSFSGLSSDVLHPSDLGMFEIASKLSARIHKTLGK